MPGNDIAPSARARAQGARLRALFEPDAALAADTRERLACLDAWYALEPEHWLAELARASTKAHREFADS